MARVYNTSFEQSTLPGVFDNQVGSTVSLDTAEHRTGARSLKFHKTGSASGSKRDAEISAGVVVGRFAFKMSAHPDAGTQILLSLVGSGGVNFNVRVDTTGKLTAIFGSTGAQTYNGGASINFGQWYVIDFRVDFTGTTYTADWRVDGTAMSQVTRTTMTPGILSTWVWDQSGPNTIDFWVDDWTYSYTGADYPLADRSEFDSETLNATGTATGVISPEVFNPGTNAETLKVNANITPILANEVAAQIETLVCAANAPPSLASQLLTTVDLLKVNAAATPSLPDPSEFLTVAITATPALQSQTYQGGGGGWGPAVIWSGGGEMTVAVNPTDHNKVIVGGDTSGIKISADGGQSWRMSNASMRQSSWFQIASLAYHPDGSKAWALVGSSGSGTLLESSDDGATWTDVAASQPDVFGCGNGKGAFPDNAHPRSTGRLIAIDDTNGYIYVATYKMGVYRAQLSDIANTWQQIADIPTGGSNYYLRSICFGEDASGNPDFDVVYAGSSTRASNSLGGDVLRITNPRDLPATRVELTACPVNPNRLLPWKGKLLVSCTQGGDEGLYVLASAKTAAATTAWVKLWSPVAGSGTYINSLAKSGSAIIAGLDNPGTASFNAPILKLTTSDSFATAANLTVTPLPASSANVTDQIFGGHGHYHMYETDGTRILGKKNFYVDDIAVSKQDSNRIVITGPGAQITLDAGASWAPSVYGMLDIGGRRMRADPIIPARVYMTNTDRQLYCSLDRFASTFTTSKPGTGSMGTDVDFDTWSKTPAAMAASGARVYLSVADRDSNINGEVWFTDDPFVGAWTNAISVPGARCIGIRIIQDGSGATVALGFFHDTGSSNTSAGIWRKAGAGAATKIKAAGASGLLQMDGKKSASSDWRPGHAVWYFDGHSGVWRSTDFGLTWTLAFPETSSNDDTMGYVSCHPTDPNQVYVSTKTKVYLLSNALAAPASIVATDITGSITNPGAIDATPDGVVVVAERASSAHAPRLWSWIAGNEATQSRVDDSYYQGLVGFPHDLSRSLDGQMYASTDGAGMGRTQTGGGVTEQSLSVRGDAAPRLVSEVYVPAGTALIETLVLPAVATGKIPSARVRQLVGFGNSAPDSTANDVAKDILIASRFTAPNVPGGFDLVGIRARMDNPNAVDSAIKAVAYSADGPDPGSQASQGATPEVAVPASSGAAWYETAFDSPRRLPAGADFYLALMVKENARLYGGAPPNVRTAPTPYAEAAPPPPGAAFWGVAKSENLGDPDSVVTAVEAEQGRIFAAIRKNYSAGSSPQIAAEVTRSFDYGRKWVYVNGKPKTYMNGDTDTSGTFWRSVADGFYDAQLNGYYAAVTANGRWSNALPYNYSWHHEQYILTEGAGGANAGTAADYIAAHQHVWQLLQDGNYHISKGGCFRLCFVPQWQQFFRDSVYGVASLATGPSNLPGYTFTDLNPGAAYYDILGADIYVPRFGIDSLTDVQPARQMFKPVHDACVAMGKPMIVPEVGIANERGAAYQVAYLQELMDLLTGWGAGDGPGQFLAICWTHKNSTNGDYRLDFLPEALAQYVAMANHPFFSAVIS